MPLDVRIISGGTTYYLVNSSAAPTPGGAATGHSTTPYSINTGQWVLTATVAETTTSGGPPFRIGSQLIGRSYGNVTETIQIGITGSSNDNAVALKHQLYRILNTALFGAPAIISWLPHGGTSPVYFEVYNADIQETPRPLNLNAGFAGTVWCNVTWIRSPFGGRLTTPETLINGVSITNNGSGSPNNLVSLGVGAGELIYEGQPLNIQVATPSAGVGTLWAASVLSRTYGTTGAGPYSTTNANPALASGYQITLAAWNVAAAVGSSRLKGRVCCVVAGASNLRVRVVATLAGNTPALYTSPWMALPGGLTYLMDMGGFALTALRQTRGVSAWSPVVYLQYISSDGGLATLTLTNTEFLLYYDFCVVTEAIASTQTLALDAFPEAPNTALLPYQPRAWVLLSGGRATDRAYRGTVPRYYSGASLWVAWHRSAATPNYVSTDTATLTATHAPLYRTLRGAG